MFWNFWFDIADAGSSDGTNEFKGDYNFLYHQNCKMCAHIVKYSFLKSKYFRRILPMIAVSIFAHGYVLNIISALKIFQVNNDPEYIYK